MHGERIGLIAPFALSPDGTELVYATCRYPDPYRAAQREAAGEPLDREDYRHELARVRVDGTQHQRLTTNRDFETDPVWSPDGTRIAFYFREDDKGYGFFFPRKPFGLYTMAPDGSDIVQLQSEAMALSVSPRWSPDSERLVYGRYESESEGQWELWLYTIPVAGGAPQRLTLAASGASWSPDGQRIAFAKADGDEVALYTIAADGTDAQRVTTITGWQSRDGELDPTRAWIPIVAWSPDGSKILYSCGRICVVTQDGTPVRQPTRPEDPAEPIAAWAPDGSRIATVDFGGPQPNRRHDPVVSTMAPDGSDVQVLVTPGAAGFPVAAQSGYADVGASQAACAAGFVVDAPADNPGLVRDCEVLLELRDGFFGSTLVNWGPGTPIAQWVGVTVGDAPPRVTGLTVEREGNSSTTVERRIPAELGQLTQLRVLDLRFNQLTGGIPPAVTQLVNLRELRLRANQLMGSIPPALGQLAQLKVLDLSGNQLTGAIPPALGQLAQLKVLDLSGNQLTGAIPPALGQLAQLKVLDLSGNQLTGAIPPALGQLAQLKVLDLSGNQLTGAIPPALGQLAQLKVLDLSHNQLAGAIPPEFGQLGQLALLTRLFLDRNQLTGPIPATLGQLAQLRTLDLQFNQLIGAIPPALGQLANVEWLVLSHNQLTGTIPAELSHLRNLGML